MPNGEVEGPGTHAGEGTRAHTVFLRPRRKLSHAPRPPPTIVRVHAGTADLSSASCPRHIVSIMR